MESASFITQLGIDWKLLLSQAVNFLLLLAILRFFVYKPILSVLKKRREKIEDGLAKAQEADTRLKEVDVIAKKKIKQAQDEAVGIIKTGEQKGKEVEVGLIKKAQEKEILYMKKIDAEVENRKIEAEEEIRKEAVRLVKTALIKTVELAPEKVDETLIKKAVGQIR